MTRESTRESASGTTLGIYVSFSNNLNKETASSCITSTCWWRHSRITNRRNCTSCDDLHASRRHEQSSTDLGLVVTKISRVTPVTVSTGLHSGRTSSINNWSVYQQRIDCPCPIVGKTFNNPNNLCKEHLDILFPSNRLLSSKGRRSDYSSRGAKRPVIQDNVEAVTLCHRHCSGFEIAHNQNHINFHFFSLC